jgi:hypothetical protein
LKKAHFHSIDRNPPENLDNTFNWITRWKQTIWIIYANRVFIDEAAFRINMKRTVAWSKVGTRAEVVVPKIRAKTTTVLGAISAVGVINIKVRRPRASVQSKKRKTRGGMPASRDQGRSGTVAGHYFNCVGNTMDVLDKHEQFKGHCIVMDNAPIHKNSDIEKEINRRGYGYIHLSPYSPEFNPIEQFWSVCKSKMKREELSKEETLYSIKRDASNNIL